MSRAAAVCCLVFAAVASGVWAAEPITVTTLRVPDRGIQPQVAVDDTGRFVVAWSSNGQDGSAYGVFAQRFAKLAVMDVDGNGAVTPLTDGLLVLRFLFGFSGATLTTGAIGPGCTRCDAAAIVPYLEGLD